MQKATRQRQEHPGTPTHKPGRAYKGANFVAQHDASAKKNAGRSAAVKKAATKK